jgi:hypothetical protein
VIGVAARLFCSGQTSNKQINDLFAEYAIQHAYEALNVLIAVMRDTEQPGATRAAARRQDPQSRSRQGTAAHRHHCDAEHRDRLSIS